MCRGWDEEVRVTWGCGHVRSVPCDSAQRSVLRVVKLHDFLAVPVFFLSCHFLFLATQSRRFWESQKFLACDRREIFIHLQYLGPSWCEATRRIFIFNCEEKMTAYCFIAIKGLLLSSWTSIYRVKLEHLCDKYPLKELYLWRHLAEESPRIESIYDRISFGWQLLLYVKSLHGMRFISDVYVSMLFGLKGCSHSVYWHKAAPWQVFQGQWELYGEGLLRHDWVRTWK